jgi:hypothetical protein
VTPSYRVHVLHSPPPPPPANSFGTAVINTHGYGELRVVPAPRQRLRSVASPVEFIPPVRVLGLSSGARGNHPYSGGEVTIVRAPPIRVMLWRPRTGAAGQAAILCVRQLGSQALVFVPHWVIVSQRSQCIAIIQYTSCRVGSLPPLHRVTLMASDCVCV